MAWYALRTYHKKEYEVQEYLSCSLGVEVFCPKEARWVWPRKKKGKRGDPVKSERPLIPGYIFVQLHLTNVFFDKLFGRIMRTRNVSGFLICDDVPVRIPDGIIDDIRLREVQGAFERDPPPNPDEALEAEDSEAAADTEAAASLPDEVGEAADQPRVGSAATAKKMKRPRPIPLGEPADLAIDARVVAGVKACIRVGQWAGRIFTVKEIHGAMAILDAEMFGKAFPLPVPLDHLQYHKTAINTCQSSQAVVNA